MSYGQRIAELECQRAALLEALRPFAAEDECPETGAPLGHWDEMPCAFCKRILAAKVAIWNAEGK